MTRSPLFTETRFLRRVPWKIECLLCQWRFWSPNIVEVWSEDEGRDQHHEDGGSLLNRHSTWRWKLLKHAIVSNINHLHGRHFWQTSEKGRQDKTALAGEITKYRSEFEWICFRILNKTVEPTSITVDLVRVRILKIVSHTKHTKYRRGIREARGTSPFSGEILDVLQCQRGVPQMFALFQRTTVSFNGP